MVLACLYIGVFVKRVLGIHELLHRPDAAASFLDFLFLKIQKDIACSRTAGVMK